MRLLLVIGSDNKSHWTLHLQEKNNSVEKIDQYIELH